MYFDKSGKDNTEKTMELAVKAAKERGINYIVVASNHGISAEYLKDSGLKVVVVTHVNGFTKPGVMEMTIEERERLESHGFKVYTATHVLSGAERGLSKKFSGAYPVEIIANTLRMLGQGVKVALEVSVMALDGGLIPYGEDIIAVGGSGRGADTAVVLKPSHAASILESRIKEIICKPREW